MFLHYQPKLISHLEDDDFLTPLAPTSYDFPVSHHLLTSVIPREGVERLLSADEARADPLLVIPREGVERAGATEAYKALRTVIPREGVES